VEDNMNPKETSLSCTRCNHLLQERDLVEQNGPMLIYRCVNCGNEAVVHVVPVPLEKRLDEQCAVSIEWENGIPAVSELSALRRLIPQFREYPITKLKGMVDKQTRLELGVYVKGEALDLQREGVKLGLTVIIEEK
jgi:hypothetical protein